MMLRTTARLYAREYTPIGIDGSGEDIMIFTCKEIKYKWRRLSPNTQIRWKRQGILSLEHFKDVAQASEWDRLSYVGAVLNHLWDSVETEPPDFLVDAYMEVPDHIWDMHRVELQTVMDKCDAIIPFLPSSSSSNKADENLRDDLEADRVVTDEEHFYEQEMK